MFYIGREVRGGILSASDAEATMWAMGQAGGLLVCSRAVESECKFSLSCDVDMRRRTDARTSREFEYQSINKGAASKR